MNPNIHSAPSSARFTKIGIFLDGSFFSHVSHYYKWRHPRAARLSLVGLQNFIRRRVAEGEGQEERYCHVVDSHFFRGRLSARESRDRDSLYTERVFDEALMRSGIQTHYLPVSQSKEKGVDVLLALEAYERAVFKGLDVCALVAGDGDFVPLVRKLHTLGTRVMVLGWNIRFEDQDGLLHETRISHHLLEEATYPVLVSDQIDATEEGADPLIDGLFYRPANGFAELEDLEDAPDRVLENPVSPATRPGSPQASLPLPNAEDGDAERNRCRGRIILLRDNWGFIAREGDERNFFFHESDVRNRPYTTLRIGDWVDFLATANDRGPYAQNVRNTEQ